MKDVSIDEIQYALRWYKQNGMAKCREAMLLKQEMKKRINNGERYGENK